MPDTMGSLAAEVTRWLRGDFLDDDGQQQIRDAINNAIASIWNSMMLVQLSKLMGPVTGFTLASNVERLQLVSILDPTVAPATATIAGGLLPLRTYSLGYTFVTASGTETLLSPLTAQIVALNFLAQVTAPANPGTAVGWNLYAGILNKALQNQQPLPFGVVVTEKVDGFQDYPASQQVPPTSNTTADDIAYISHLESHTQNDLYLAWNQSSIDSSIMRRASRMIPVASEYQRHAWDLLNGTTLEFRPRTGIAYDGRYFYVRKPRRILYDSVETPSQNVIQMHEFIVAFSMKQCKMGLEEGGGATRWDKEAEAARISIMQALNQENWAKDNRVVPYMR